MLSKTYEVQRRVYSERYLSAVFHKFMGFKNRSQNTGKQILSIVYIQDCLLLISYDLNFEK